MKPIRVIFLCPSKDKECGIARYTCYAKDSLQDYPVEAYIAATTYEVDGLINASKRNGAKTLLVVQHEYGLFDYFNIKLGMGQTTSQVVSYINQTRHAGLIDSACFVMHTLVTSDHVLNQINKQIFSSGVRVFHLNSTGAIQNGIEYLEHGVYSPPFMSNKNTKNGPPTIGAFGMASDNKMISEVINLAARTNYRLIGQFATRDQSRIKAIESYARSALQDYILYYDFTSEDEIYLRLSNSTVFVSFQDDIQHTASSGSIRFLMSIGKPVICNYARQFFDAMSGTITSTIEEATGHLALLRDNQDYYEQHRTRAISFCLENRIQDIYIGLFEKLLEPETSIPLYLATVGAPDSKNLYGVDVHDISTKPKEPRVFDPYLYVCLPVSLSAVYLDTYLSDLKAIRQLVVYKELDLLKSLPSRIAVLKNIAKTAQINIDLRYSTNESVEVFLKQSKHLYLEQLLLHLDIVSSCNKEVEHCIRNTWSELTLFDKNKSSTQITSLLASLRDSLYIKGFACSRIELITDYREVHVAHETKSIPTRHVKIETVQELLKPRISSPKSNVSPNF